MYNAYFLPKFLRAKQGCALYMGIMITYHGYNNGHNNPMYNVHKHVGEHYTQQNMAIDFSGLLFFNPHPRICSLLIFFREREKPQCERETSVDCLPYSPQLGSQSTTQV